MCSIYVAIVERRRNQGKDCVTSTINYGNHAIGTALLANRRVDWALSCLSRHTYIRNVYIRLRVRHDDLVEKGAVPTLISTDSRR